MELRSLIFKVITEICVLIVVIVLLIFGFVCILSGPLFFNNYGFICLFIVTLPCSFFSSAQNITSYVFLGFGLLDIILFRMLMLLIVFFPSNMALQHILFYIDCHSLSGLGIPCSVLFWLSKFPLRNQLLFWLVFLYMWLGYFSLATFISFLCYIYSVF